MATPKHIQKYYEAFLEDILWSAYDIPVLKANGRRKYSDEFEKAYLEYFNERKEDLK